MPNDLKLIKVPIFETFIRVVVCDSMEDLRSFVERANLDSESSGAAAFVHRVGHLAYLLVFLKADLSPGIVAHECLHIADEIFDDIGSKEARYVPEVRHYLLQYLTDEVTKRLKKHGYVK